MDSEELAKVVDEQFDTCRRLLTRKAEEYAPTDRLHNFRVAAELQGVTLEKALGGMMAKHTVSLYDLIEREESVWSDLWAEKIDDHLNYLLLLRAILVDKRRADSDDVNVKVNPVQEAH